MKNLKAVMFMVIMLFVCVRGAYAGTYTYYLGGYSTNYGNTSHDVGGIDLVGINNTHYFTQKIPATVTGEYAHGEDRYTLHYTLPDDGSNWSIVGTVTIVSSGDTGTGGTTIKGMSTVNINLLRNTPGTFTGYSLKTAADAANAANIAAGQARTAANNAVTAASTASTRATNALNAVSDLNGNTITAVRDASGTVLEASRSAYNEANTANTKIDYLQTTVNNIENVLGQDSAAPVVKLRTVSGAMATSGNSIQAVISASDNVSTVFDYSLDGIGYQPLSPDGVVDLPINNSGKNLITVWVRDAADNTGRESITIRKL